MKTITTRRLIDSKTGQPFTFHFTDEEYKEKILPMRRAGWEAGARFRMGLMSAGVIENTDDIK